MQSFGISLLSKWTSNAVISPVHTRISTRFQLHTFQSRFESTSPDSFKSYVTGSELKSSCERSIYRQSTGRKRKFNCALLVSEMYCKCELSCSCQQFRKDETFIIIIDDQQQQQQQQKSQIKNKLVRWSD